MAPTSDSNLDPASLVPRAFALRNRVVPLGMEHGRLVVATASEDFGAIDAVRFATGMPVLEQGVDAAAFAALVQQTYGREAPVEILPPAPAKPEPDASTDAPIVALVGSLIAGAVEARASDIHFEPMRSRFRVRIRVDGELREMPDPPLRLGPAIVSRLKLMAGMSLAEKRRPQDGRGGIDAAGRRIDLRISSVPALHGESVVVRLLDAASLRPRLADLGFLEDDLQRWSRTLETPAGLVLVTGPTGSGKTTTLYSSIERLNGSDRKIVTVEDPVEYRIPGINQVQVQGAIGMTFASALRAILRQSPNIVMIGEIRDAETAGVAINAGLTGHLVFSTLHTGDAVGAVARLLDMGVAPAAVASGLRAVLAQRLVRRTCVTCRGAGCGHCEGSGYRGRLAVVELLEIDDELRALIHHRAPESKLREKARERAPALWADAARKVTAGLTTPEEVASMAPDDAG